MRVKFHQPAEPDERFMPGSFDGVVGQSCPFKVCGVERGQATLVAAKVAEDGASVELTVDLPDAAAVGPLTVRPGGRFAFAPGPDLSVLPLGELLGWD